MISEKQKYLIFYIHCFYQLESQTEKISSGQPIEFLPDVALLTLNSNGAKINWHDKKAELQNELISIGMSENWIKELKSRLKQYLSNGNTIEQFRTIFLDSTNVLLAIITNMVANSNPSIPKYEIVTMIISDIFDKNYWEGESLEQVNSIRRLSNILGFDKLFVIEFGKIFIRTV